LERDKVKSIAAAEMRSLPTQPGSTPVAHFDSAQVGQARLASGEGRGGGVATAAVPEWTPTPDPSPQGGGEKKGPVKDRFN